jgi:hypothetical protein
MKKPYKKITFSDLQSIGVTTDGVVHTGKKGRHVILRKDDKKLEIGVHRQYDSLIDDTLDTRVFCVVGNGSNIFIGR